MKRLTLWLIAVLLRGFIPACSHKVVFDNLNAANTAVLGKSGHDTMVALGIPDSVTAGGEVPRRSTVHGVLGLPPNGETQSQRQPDDSQHLLRQGQGGRGYDPRRMIYG